MKTEKIKKILDILMFQVYSDTYDELKKIKDDENLYEKLYNNESLENIERAERLLNQAIDELEEFLKKNQ